MSARTILAFGSVWRCALAAGLLLAAMSTTLAQTSPYSTSYRYDSGRRLTGILQPDPDDTGPLHFPALRNTYNAAGLLATVETGELSAWQSASIAPTAWSGFTIHTVLSNTYDSAGRLLSAKLQATGTTYSLTQFSYDAGNRVECRAVRMDASAFTSVPANACTLGATGSDGPDRVTRFSYDAWDRVLTEIRAHGTGLQQTYATYSYTGRHLTSLADAKQNLQTFSHDGLGRREFWYFPSKTTTGQSSSSDYEQYGYDENGNLRTLRKRDARVITNTYDALNRITKRDVPGTTADVYYGYDLRGLLRFARFGSVNGQGVTDFFDGFGRVTQSTTDVGGTSRTVFSDYDANGNRTRITQPDGEYFEYDYDRLNRLTQIAENAANTLIYRTYNAQSRLGSISRGASVSASTYAYDLALRLQSIGHDLDGAGTTNDVTLGFGYNAAGQITSKTLSNNSYENTIGSEARGYAVNGLNQYTQITSPGSVTPTYDANGNLTSDGATTFGYDIENRLTTAAGAKNATLSYDPKGRLYQVSGTSSTTQFLYDGDRLIAEYDASGNISRRYVHGIATDEPLVGYEGSQVSTSTRRYYYTDHQGSVVATASGTGSTLWRNNYDTYGVPAAGNLGRFQYTGQALLPELGLYYYKARIYNPTLGRFMQTDPIGYDDDFNLYAYVKNDPLNGVDPLGTECVNGANGTTNCVTDNYDVSFTTPDGFQNTDPDAADYHEYEILGDSSLGEQETRDWVRNNPTPGNPDPATPEGTVNDATPVIGGLPGNISPVQSFVTTNELTGREVVVNATLPNHPLGNGIVVREVVPNPDGTSTIVNRGEGNGALQAPGSIVRDPINNVWKGQVPYDPVGASQRFDRLCRSHPGAC